MTGPVYLIGYMGAGKTTVGKMVADMLGWHFVDLDTAFAEIHGAPPADYIRQHGIEAFRRKEKYVLEDIADMSPFDNVIYATGGGYPCWEDNMDCLRELGTSIYLKWQAEDLVKRLMLTDLTQRPVLQGRTEAELLSFIQPQLEAREEFYEQADFIVRAQQATENTDRLLAKEIYCLLINT